MPSNFKKPRKTDAMSAAPLKGLESVTPLSDAYSPPLRSYEIRPATENDFDAIARIYTHHVLHGTATFEIDPPSREAMIERWKEIKKLELPFLAAERDGAVIGYAYANAYRPRPAYRFTIEDSIYIDSERLGQGCGQALLRELIRQCSEGPWEQMIAIIGDSANHASVRLHERFGFEHVGTLRSVGFKFERWLDTVIMQRSLKT